MTLEKKRRITAEDLYQIKLVSDPQISPDGKQIIFCVQTIEPKTEKKFNNLWLVNVDESENDTNSPHQFTYGNQSDSHPRWSPDGSQIAFISNRADEKQAQIYLIPLNGGEARPLTSLTGTIANFAWSPDGTKLVCQFRKKDEAVIEREKDEQKKKLGLVERHITRLDFRGDAMGYFPEERWHIWTIDAKSGEATQLTDGDLFHETNPQWSPDGAQILFSSNRLEQPDLNWNGAEFYLMPATSGEMYQLDTGDSAKFQGTFSPTGQAVAFHGKPDRTSAYQNDGLFVVPLPDGEMVNLAAATDLHCSVATMTDSGNSGITIPPVWSADGQVVYSQVSHHGRQPLLGFSMDGTAPQPIIDGDGVVESFSFAKTGNRIAYVWSSIDQVGELWLLDLENGEARQLTYLNEALFSEIDLGQTEEVWFKAIDGANLQGWITFPPEFDASQSYPSILEIHGGPLGQYGRFFMHEFFYLAAQGYVVYWSNPRGGQGYGQAHSSAIENSWGTVDYDDVMAWADYMAQQPYIDSARMGVTGGSYGGYMTSLIIGKTERFKAAVAQRVVSNLISFYGASDLNATRAEMLVGTTAPPWANLDNYWLQSPMKYIGNAKTPTLVIHSEQDLRCPEEQGTQVFTALKRLGVDTELVLFPEESHGLSRMGRTDRRIARLNHILRWFDKYLE